MSFITSMSSGPSQPPAGKRATTGTSRSAQAFGAPSRVLVIPSGSSSSRSSTSRKLPAPWIRRTASPRSAWASAGEYCTRSPGSPMRSSSPIALMTADRSPSCSYGSGVGVGTSAARCVSRCAIVTRALVHAAEAVGPQELGDDVGDRRRQRQQPAVDGVEHERVRERLRHREDPEDVVALGRAAGLAVREADRLVQADLPVARDDDDGAVVALLVDVALDAGPQPLEALGVEAVRAVCWMVMRWLLRRLAWRPR